MGGDLSISKSNPGANRQIRKVRRMIAHKSYDPKTLSNDIAMIFVRVSLYIYRNVSRIVDIFYRFYQLKTPFEETSTFAPIPLTMSNVREYQPCIIGILFIYPDFTKNLSKTNVIISIQFFL